MLGLLPASLNPRRMSPGHGKRGLDVISSQARPEGVDRMHDRHRGASPIVILPMLANLSRSITQRQAVATLQTTAEAVAPSWAAAFRISGRRSNASQLSPSRVTTRRLSACACDTIAETNQQCVAGACRSGGHRDGGIGRRALDGASAAQRPPVQGGNSRPIASRPHCAGCRAGGRTGAGNDPVGCGRSVRVAGPSHDGGRPRSAAAPSSTRVLLTHRRDRRRASGGPGVAHTGRGCADHRSRRHPAPAHRRRFHTRAGRHGTARCA